MIRLAMLTYNEADNLPIIAASLSKVIDSWVILDDTKSTDGTEAVAYQVFGEELSLPGSVHKTTLTSFADARNELLTYAREGLSPDDYILIIDPDDRPEGEITVVLSHNLYFVKYYNNVTEWMVPFLIKASFPCHYEGAAHELLITGDEIAILLPDDFRVQRLGAGASEERVLWTIDLLSKELDNPRSVFYLANSYKHLHREAEALYYYLKRANMNGYDPETYYAMYAAATIALDIDQSVCELMCRKAILFRSDRKEPYYILGHLFNVRGEHTQALEELDKGISLPPCEDSFFVDRWIEGIGLFMERHIARVALGLEKEGDIANANYSLNGAN